MTDSPQSIDRELIRYRIKKRMAGRRDLLLHLVIYVALALIYLANTAPKLPQHYILLGGLWTIPFILHGLRYYYRCGPGAMARADEIESALEDQLGRTALDDEEELLIEERVSKRINARRVAAAHLITAALVLGLLWLLTAIWTRPMFNLADLSLVSQFWGIALALHIVRFFLVHGRTSAGRALKIEAEVERQWFQSREGRSARADADASGEDDFPLLELGELRGHQMRLNAEGEFENGDELALGATQRRWGRRPQ